MWGGYCPIHLTWGYTKHPQLHRLIIDQLYLKLPYRISDIILSILNYMKWYTVIILYQILKTSDSRLEYYPLIIPPSWEINSQTWEDQLPRQWLCRQTILHKALFSCATNRFPFGIISGPYLLNNFIFSM